MVNAALTRHRRRSAIADDRTRRTVLGASSRSDKKCIMAEVNSP